MTTHTLCLRRCRAIEELVQKYGPIVRVDPNTVIFVDIPTFRSVYGVSSKLAKAPFYKSLLTAENDHVMTTLDHGSHSMKKKGYAPHYIPTNLALFQPEIHKIMLKLVDLLTQVSNLPDPVTDTLVIFRHLLADLNYHISRKEPTHLLSDAIDNFPKRGLIRSALPVWLWNLLVHIPVARWKRLCGADACIARFVEDRVREARSELLNERDEDSGEKIGLVTRLLNHKYSNDVPMPEKDIISECMGNLIAGTDTMSITLSYVLWELSCRRDVMIRLQQELDGKMNDPRMIPDIRELQELPFLTAVIKEGLRVHTSVPSPLPRVVPTDNYVVLGHKLPAGTVIASQAYSSHRCSEIFFSPELFLPSRWLMDDPAVITVPSSSLSPSCVSQFKSETVGADDISAKLNPSSAHTQMAAHMFPFGHGPRVCAGQNMAQMILRIALATIVRNFDIVTAHDTNEQSMAMKDSFVTFPASLKCRLIFVPRAQ